MEYQENNESVFDLNIDSTTATQLNATGKWARFSAIFVWVLLGVLFLFLVFFSSKLGDLLSTFGNSSTKYGDLSAVMSGSLKTIMIVVFAVVFGLGALFNTLMFSFGSNLLKATDNQDQSALEKAFNSYKIYLIITGVFVILGTVITLFSLLTLFK